MTTYKYNLINLDYLKNKDFKDIQKYLFLNGAKKFGIDDTEALCSFISNIDSNNKNRRYYNVSYNVSRLDKEFDLVKLGDNILINIELKLSSSDLRQCEENYKIFANYYREYEINIYCYTKKENKLYKYCDGELIEAGFVELNKKLFMIENAKSLNINIDISSVYTEPDFFLNKKYKLSRSQEEVKKKLIESEKKINIVCGRAGSGKTLLALDLYNTYKEKGFDVFYLAPFKYKDIINEKLIKAINIITPSEFINLKHKCDVIICDEAQRIYISNLESFSKVGFDKIILIGDSNQNIDSECSFVELYNATKENFVINLSSVIRTDDTFDIFAKKILGLSCKNIKNKRYDRSKIEISMLEENSLKDIDEFTFLQPSQSLYFANCSDDCNNKFCTKFKRKCVSYGVPHTVIGKEYNNVLLYFCDGYKYNGEKIVQVKKVCYGNLDKQLYSLITRSVNKLKIITTDIEIYNFLVEKRDEIA